MRALSLVRDTVVGPSAGDIVLALAEVPVSRGERLQSPGAVYGKDTSLFGNAQVVAGGDDTNPALVGRAKFDVYREMRLSDPACRSLDWMMRLPIRAADWTLIPAGDDPIDRVIADALGWQFGLKIEGSSRRNSIGRLSQTWKESIAQAMFVLPYGCMCEEIVWSKTTEAWVDADGDSHIVRPITRLAPRMPRTILDVEVDDDGQIVEVEQDLPDAKPIPGWKVVWYTLDPEGDVWGTSMLRPAYGPWKLKQGLMTGAAIGWDRWASGLPIVRYPAGRPGAEARANAIGKGIRAHERGWVALEGGATGDSEWGIEILNGSGSIGDPTGLLQHYDSQIAMAGLQQFSSLGITQSGSRAVGDVLSKPFYEAAQAIADDLAVARMRQVFRRWIDHNFGAAYEMPELVATGVEADDLALLGTVLADLASAGLSFTDAETQNDVRRRIKLRELPEEAAAAIAKLPPGVGVTVPGLPAPGEGDSIAA